MRKNSFLIYDSGIGGINFLIFLKSKYPFLNLTYFSDSKNAPYGNKTKEWLFNRVRENLNKINLENFDGVIFACNTISTTILHEISACFKKVKFYGIFPRVELAEKDNVLLVCTPLTASSVYIMKAKSTYKNLVVAPCSSLVEWVEENALTKAIFNPEKFLPKFNQSFSYVLVGCTHFCFVKNYIANFYQTNALNFGIVGMDDHFKGQADTFDHNLNFSGEKRGEICFIFEDKKRNFEIFKKFENCVCEFDFKL